MPQLDYGKTRVKQYKVALVAATPKIGISANNPSRNYLKLFNAGANPLSYWFDDSADNGQGIILGPGQEVDFWPTPGELLSASSVLGSTLVILEGWDK